MYQKRTSQGGMITLVIFIATCLMIWYEVQHYLRIEPEYSFTVDSHVGHSMQINLDVAVNTTCSRTCRKY